MIAANRGSRISIMAEADQSGPLPGRIQVHQEVRMNTIPSMLKIAAAAVFLSLLALTSCWQDFNDAFIGTSASTPPEVTFAASLMTSSSVTLNWTEPDAVTYSGTRITYTGNGSTTEITLAKGTTTYMASGLTGGVKYTFTVYATYSSGYESAGAAFTITPMDKTLRFTYTAEQLSDVRNGGLGDYCVLMADVDLSGYSSGTGWTPIGTSSSKFNGIFDGNGHTISNCMVDDDTAQGAGLFGYMMGAYICDLGVVDCYITGWGGVGGLAGGRIEFGWAHRVRSLGSINR